MARAFYPFVEEGQEGAAIPGGPVRHDAVPPLDEARYAARIAVYDDLSAAPRVVVVEPKDTRSYLEEITATVTKLAHEQGGQIPFMVIREVVENLIHAYFIEPAISILNDGNTIRFADQGPGIKEKDRALEYGTTSATEEMKRYIRGVGSGLPYAQQYLHDKGGTLTIEDNIASGTIVTIEMPQAPRQAAAVQAFGATAPVQEVPQQPAVTLSERGQLVVDYLGAHESVGPKELVETYGRSQATWTRELQTLEAMGVVAKRGGQKRYLTDAGRLLLGL